MLDPAPDYDMLRARFRWRVPVRYNIASAACDAWAAREPDRVALIHRRPDGGTDRLTYAWLRAQSNRLANALVAHGLGRGDRVALILPQMPETVVAHLAIYKLGAIAVPLSILFGADALAYRLGDSGARAVIATGAASDKLGPLRQRLPDLSLIVSIDGPGDGALSWQTLLDAARDSFTGADTGPDDPALMVYTSGTTGQPKGALHGHRVLIGHLPGAAMSHEFLPQPGDILWTPADWAWAGGLLNVLLPGLAYGVPVVAARFDKFDPERAFALMEETGLRNAFIPPTALRMLRAVENPRLRYTLHLRTVSSAGESLGREPYDWAREALGLTVNEFYGQTECNYVIASCAAIGVSRAGAIGRPVPGHDVAVIGSDGTPVAVGSEGQIAVRRPDPVMFLEYWRNPAATEAKFVGDWMMTGDRGLTDEDGYIHFIGRDDDVITSSGYRIGPGEIEDCLIAHPAVALAAVIGKPDTLRTEIVKAFVVLKDGYMPSEELASGIQAFVRERLSAHEYPREVAFLDALPLTTTGKIIRRKLRDMA